MDWDVPPTEFNEYVTIKGTATTTFLELSHDDGFATVRSARCPPARSIAGTTDVDFTDNGPNDHGAYFRFNFGTLADNAKREFDIFYGAAGTERACPSGYWPGSYRALLLGSKQWQSDRWRPGDVHLRFQGCWWYAGRTAYGSSGTGHAGSCWSGHGRPVAQPSPTEITRTSALA